MTLHTFPYQASPAFHPLGCLWGRRMQLTRIRVGRARDRLHRTILLIGRSYFNKSFLAGLNDHLHANETMHIILECIVYLFGLMFFCMYLHTMYLHTFVMATQVSEGTSLMSFSSCVCVCVCVCVDMEAAVEGVGDV